MQGLLEVCLASESYPTGLDETRPLSPFWPQAVGGLRETYRSAEGGVWGALRGERPRSRGDVLQIQNEACCKGEGEGNFGTPKVFFTSLKRLIKVAGKA